MWNSSLNPAAYSHFTFNLQTFHKSKCELLGIWFATAGPFSNRISGKIMHLQARDYSECNIPEHPSPEAAVLPVLQGKALLWKFGSS